MTIPRPSSTRPLALCPQIFLLGILFRHRAFEAPSLMSPETISKLDIYPGEQELPLPLKASMKDVFIFRRAIKTLVGYEVSPDTRITYQMMSGWIKRIGELLGLEIPNDPIQLADNAGNAFDKSSMFGPVSTQTKHPR